MDDFILETTIRVALEENDPYYNEFIDFVLSPHAEPPSWFLNEEIRDQMEFLHTEDVSNPEVNTETPPASGQRVGDPVESPDAEAFILPSTPPPPPADVMMDSRVHLHPLRHNPYSQAETQRECPHNEDVSDSQGEIETPPANTQHVGDSEETPGAEACSHTDEASVSEKGTPPAHRKRASKQAGGHLIRLTSRAARKILPIRGHRHRMAPSHIRRTRRP
ncbi:uncharacterized protein [Antennarius striatus]|uniref:uncharacterized protein n=1 Tax=Antennarius striatus TaxID=241820 RepID=UPI0035AD8A42